MCAKKKFWQLVRFFISGGVAITTSYSLLYVLTDWFHIWYFLSDVVSVAVNYTITFFFHKYWTYGDKTTHAMKRQIRIYGLMVAGFYVSNIILEPVFVEYVGMNYMLAQCVISALLTVVSLIVTPRLFHPEPPAAS